MGACNNPCAANNEESEIYTGQQRINNGYDSANAARRSSNGVSNQAMVTNLTAPN